MFLFAFLSLFCSCWLILVLISCIYCKYVLRPSLNLGDWRCRLNLSMFLLTISVGRFWSIQSVLEFSAIKKNLRIISDIERVFWTVLFRMTSRVFVFFTPSDSSLVRNWLVCREPRTPVSGINVSMSESSKSIA